MGAPILLLPAPEGDGDGQQQQSPPAAAAGGAPPKPDPPPTVATHTCTIGIIHPPPDIHVIIEKTSTFVAKNRPKFERRIVSDNQGNAKFNFLQPFVPYHAYYQHRISELTTQPAAPDASVAPESDDFGPPPPLSAG